MEICFTVHSHSTTENSKNKIAVNVQLDNQLAEHL